ncbi:MAG TPA: trehalase family glycosidase [bacterium]|nr:trehalase family glycosidase [bacterium]HNT66532.1 trehalase family glycosidase [bacterium]
MSNHYRDLFPKMQAKLNEFIFEVPQETENLLSLPYPYIASSKDGTQSYADTFFINLGLLHLKQIEMARYNVENLLSLFSRFGYIPASNRKDKSDHSELPFLPWMVRDVYRSTGDKEWLRRVLPTVIDEYHFWTEAPHRSSSGLYRFKSHATDTETARRLTMAESLWIDSPRFQHSVEIDPIDLNALLYRNALLIHDLQIEADGQGDPTWLKKAEKLKKMIEICWDNQQSFYFDNNFGEKTTSPIKSLASFMPLFVEMVDSTRAEKMVKKIALFFQPGGLSCTDQDYGYSNRSWNYPLGYAPYVYLILKGMMDYDFLEDAADIGNNWLSMVAEVYEKTGEFWEWYNVVERRCDTPTGIQNKPVWGWTIGTFIAIVDELGLV